MAKPLLEDLRSRVLVAIDSGMSRGAAAERFSVGLATAVRWMHEWRMAGASCVKAKGGEAIEAASVRLRYLPPYSPDFNPIEKAFSKRKALLRKAAVTTIHGLWGTFRRAVPQFTPAECANYFTAAGYEPD